jgi:hypothetical protein
MHLIPNLPSKALEGQALHDLGPFLLPERQLLVLV